MRTVAMVVLLLVAAFGFGQGDLVQLEQRLHQALTNAQSISQFNGLGRVEVFNPVSRRMESDEFFIFLDRASGVLTQKATTTAHYGEHYSIAGGVATWWEDGSYRTQNFIKTPLASDAPWLGFLGDSELGNLMLRTDCTDLLDTSNVVSVRRQDFCLAGQSVDRYLVQTVKDDVVFDFTSGQPFLVGYSTQRIGTNRVYRESWEIKNLSLTSALGSSTLQECLGPGHQFWDCFDEMYGGGASCWESCRYCKQTSGSNVLCENICR